MKQLLIVYHSKSGSTSQMAKAVLEGAQDDSIVEIEVVMKSAYEANADDLLRADAVILGTPENFGYMSGALKDFFDRTFYEVEGKFNPLPCAIFICAGNDGTGALTAIRRIAKGYPLVEQQDPIIVRGKPTEDDLSKCKELGLAIATGLELGIY